MAVADMAAQGVAVAESGRDSGAPTASLTTPPTVSLSEIATRQGISLAYLEQLFGKLRKAGIVTSLRGMRGGYQLAKTPEAICLSDIIAAVDETVKVHGCSPETKQACNGLTDRCLTHNLWGALESHIEQFFAMISVADVIDGRFPMTTPLKQAGAELEVAE